MDWDNHYLFFIKAQVLIAHKIELIFDDDCSSDQDDRYGKLCDDKEAPKRTAFSAGSQSSL